MKDIIFEGKSNGVEITPQMVEWWKRDRAYGKTCFEIAEKYGVAKSVVSHYTCSKKEKVKKFIDGDKVRSITEEKFHERDIVPNRNCRGLSGKAMARLLEIDKR